jgi:hypothetical protein
MKKLILLPFLALLLTSCSEKKTTSSGNVDSIQKIFTGLRDSTNKAWQIMIKSDDQKMADMKRLLLEISYCKKFNAMRQDSVSKAVDGLKSFRYDQFTMTSEQIDGYDDQTNKVIFALKSHALATEELASHPLAEQLYNDIAKADNDVGPYRAMYDRWAFQYNDFIKTNKEQLKSESELKPLPVFSIQPNM